MARYSFVDWYRGLACVLMFQTHTYDSWTAAADRHGWLWWVLRHLGGFPARLFLLLAGVSLMLRFDSDRRRSVDVATSRRQAAQRGLEVLGLGLLFRVTEWILAGAGLGYVGDILRVDVLNCIGVSLVVSAYVASPADLDPGRIPWRPALAALTVVFATPLLTRIGSVHWLPEPVSAYFIGGSRFAQFPLFPWLSYVLVGCIVGALLIRAAHAGTLPRMCAMLAAAGVIMAVVAHLFRGPATPLYSFGDNAPGAPSPIAFFYRTGVCLLGLGAAYVITQRSDPQAFSPLRQLGTTSLLVYWVHVELVYGHASYFIKRRLSMSWATAMLALLTALMVALSYWRTGYEARRRARAATATATSP